MRNSACLIVIWLFVLFPAMGQAQGQTLPQEIVFVHMDNTCYFLGDTLYYKAYVQRSDTGTRQRT